MLQNLGANLETGWGPLFGGSPVKVEKIKTLLDYVSDGIGTVIKWISISLKALFDWGTVFDLPLMFALFIAIPVILMSIKLLKWFV